jgi:hypothetical protein
MLADLESEAAIKTIVFTKVSQLIYQVMYHHHHDYSPLLDLCNFFSFLIPYTVGRTPYMEDQKVSRQLPAPRTSQTQNEHTPTYKHTDIHTLSGNQTHNPSAFEGEDSSYLRM